MAKTNAKLFIDHLREACGAEDRILSEPAADGGPPISIFVYTNCPEPGMTTGITYGLSERAHPEWTASRPEMVLCVESTHLSWMSAAVGLTAHFCGKKRFRYGDVFTVDAPLAEDTKMNAVLIFAQSILEPEVASVQLNGYRVHLSQYFPFHRSEIPLYERIGLEKFWNHPGFGMYDPKRPPIE